MLGAINNSGTAPDTAFDNLGSVSPAALTLLTVLVPGFFISSSSGETL
jgi:hypothetical protein